MTSERELEKKALEIIALKNADLALRDRIGYPTEDRVGKEAATAAWLVIQHAIEQPDFMKKCRKLLESCQGKQGRPLQSGLSGRQDSGI